MPGELVFINLSGRQKERWVQRFSNGETECQFQTGDQVDPLTRNDYDAWGKPQSLDDDPWGLHRNCTLIRMRTRLSANDAQLCG